MVVKKTTIPQVRNNVQGCLSNITMTNAPNRFCDNVTFSLPENHCGQAFFLRIEEMIHKETTMSAESNALGKH